MASANTVVGGCGNVYAPLLPLLIPKRRQSRRTSLRAGVGGFLGGPAADRFGARNVIAWSPLWRERPAEWTFTGSENCR